MSLKSSSFIHVREKKPIALIHVREKKPISLIHGQEKQSWHSSIGHRAPLHSSESCSVHYFVIYPYKQLFMFA